MRNSWFSFLLLLVLSGNAWCQTRWTPYASEISFKIKNAGVTVTGYFEGLKADLAFDAGNLSASALSGTVDAATISTGINARNGHLRKEEYFYTDRYKVIKVASVKLYRKGDQFAGLFKVTIKNVTKEMEIPFEFIRNGNDATFKGTFTINRRDFGVGSSSLFMADEAVVTIEVKARS